jgi:mRNA interferase MazF
LRTPDYGEIAWIDFDPQVGHEQGKRRPGLVLSARSFNERFGVVLVCPISSKSYGHAFEVPIPSGLPVKGVVLVQHLKSLDWIGRRADHICSAPAETIALASDIAQEILRG